MNSTTKQTPARVNGRFVSKRALMSEGQALAQATRDQWVTTISARVQALTDAGQHVAVEWAGITKTISEPSFVNALAMLQASGSIECETLTRILGNAERTKVAKTEYVQAKTVQKIVNMVHTLAANDLHKLSDYTSQVLYAALHNGDALSIQGARASLSRRVSNVDLPRGETVDKRAPYTPGTACSQASQVREVLRILGLAAVDKGRKSDVLELNPDRAQALRDLYVTAA